MGLVPTEVQDTWTGIQTESLQEAELNLDLCSLNSP